MTVQLVRISPLRAANICGALYFVIFGAFSLVMFPFLNSMPTDPNVNAGQTESLRWVYFAGWHLYIRYSVVPLVGFPHCLEPRYTI